MTVIVTLDSPWPGELLLRRGGQLEEDASYSSLMGFALCAACACRLRRRAIRELALDFRWRSAQHLPAFFLTMYLDEAFKLSTHVRSPLVRGSFLRFILDQVLALRPRR